MAYIEGDIENWEWHKHNFSFCNGINTTCELRSGIEPINTCFNNSHQKPIERTRMDPKFTILSFTRKF
jgi:hypothetical protein